ncbi:hypothetical protein HHX47_DHR5000220 [Lentinula edodes]|nr:hypothetical protein HHX47_DHR5000220 [Lentinula edodes]
MVLRRGEVRQRLLVCCPPPFLVSRSWYGSVWKGVAMGHVVHSHVVSASSSLSQNLRVHQIRRTSMFEYSDVPCFSRLYGAGRCWPSTAFLLGRII